MALTLLELGWLPAEQAHNAVIFLLSFIILDSVAARESSEAVLAPELFTNSEDSMHALTALVPDIKHELMAVVQGNFIESEGGMRFARKVQDCLRREENLLNYVIVAAPIAELTEESFQRRLELERDPLVAGRFHYRFIDTPVSFGCQVFDSYRNPS